MWLVRATTGGKYPSSNEGNRATSPSDHHLLFKPMILFSLNFTKVKLYAKLLWKYPSWNVGNRATCPNDRHLLYCTTDIILIKPWFDHLLSIMKHYLWSIPSTDCLNKISPKPWSPFWNHNLVVRGKLQFSYFP